MQLLDLKASEGEAEQSDATSDEDEEDMALDDIDVDDASTLASSSDENEDQAQVKGAPQAKKQKIASQSQGLGSVGWEASDEEEDLAVPVAQPGETSS